MPVKDITGQRFGRLVAAALFDTNKGFARWSCLCDCGQKTIVLGTALRAGTTTSCGCRHKEITRLRSLKHGWHGTKTYESWQNMIRRCVDPNTVRYHRYGGRGITVCDRWIHSFENFLEDMGERPVGTSLERKHPDKGYYKENCCWIPKQENTIDSRNGNPSRKGLQKLHNDNWAEGVTF